jgi:hypothetical protein
LRHGHRIAWAKNYVFKCVPVFVQGYLTFGAPVDVVEDSLRQALLGETSQIFNVHDAGR